MLSEFEKKVADYMKANGLFGSTRKILLAVSGGADSTALLHVMNALKSAGVLKAEIHCAHMNHQLRGDDADLDEQFVLDRAGELNLAVTTRRLDVRGYALRNKLSIETAARQLRMQALSEIAKTNDCDAVATAHQKNDNAETVLQRLSRGTGFRGLAGIWPERLFSDGARIIRPLLSVGRDEIVAYLNERNLEWRRDHTNADLAYRRNYIRHRLLPELQRNCTGSVVEQLSTLAESALGFYCIICACADEMWPGAADCTDNEIRLDVEILLGQAPPVRVELVRRCLARLGCGERYLTQRHYENILLLAERNVSGRNMELPGGFVVYREYDKLVLTQYGKLPVGQVPPYGDKSVILNAPGLTRFGQHIMETTIVKADRAGFEQFVAGKTDRVERFDLDKISLPLTVRHRQPGDRFVPLGQTSTKKVGKFLTAQRVPPRVRDQVLVVADAEKIIWICPVRISEPAKVTRQTRRILQLRITDLESRQNSVDAAAPDQ